ncbi:hypothetical protein C8F04DRAFT_1366508 [Mycena alexandri]|uniref:MYND-type domain-containing protein n=1 Tax=Mycena alexandri TaxID=1745969 RepID=A0AAD6XD39_9AGAR|nr:hypothetical protein C8F04DRAFT_1366508 [Mycena alexandri]
MGFCYNDGCLNGAEQRCSNCKIATYCSPACQREAWSTHKRECEMNRILREHQEKEEAKPVEKPPTTHCTGCNVKYDRDEYAAEDLCADCGYTACESCVSHHSRGSCYCLESNFGRRYCNMTPQWYHMSSRTGKSYVGDRHPDDPWILEENPDAFEAQEKICGNCGEKKRCLKKEYC